MEETLYSADMAYMSRQYFLDIHIACWIIQLRYIKTILNDFAQILS